MPDGGADGMGRRDRASIAAVTTLGELVVQLERWYDPAWAESWDAVGLVKGDPEATVGSVHVAVDPTEVVAAEQVCDLLITHHPLFLGGTTSIAQTSPKGRALARMTALYVAHTNADVATPGVSDALAGVLGLRDTTPLQPQEEHLDRWVVHVPRTHTATVIDAMTAAGAGNLGGYERCAFVGAGEGTFTPLEDAQPYLGRAHEVETVDEHRIEMVASPRRRAAVAEAVRSAHPYEEPSLSVVETATPSRRGLGRLGVLHEPMQLKEFCDLVDASLPKSSWGTRATGEPDARIETVAVVGGAGLDLVELAAARGADVLLTSDAKHHRAQDAPIPVVDVAHWASEWPWTAALGERLRATYPDIVVTVSTTVTDPFTQHRAGSAR